MYGMSTRFYLKEIEELSSKITNNRKEIDALNKKLEYEDYSYYIEEYEKEIKKLEKSNARRSEDLVEEAEDFYMAFSCGKSEDSWVEKKVFQYIAATKSRLEDQKEDPDYKIKYAFMLSEYLYSGYALFLETPMHNGEVCNELVLVSDEVFSAGRYIKEHTKSYIKDTVLRVKEVGGSWITAKRVQ